MHQEGENYHFVLGSSNAIASSSGLVHEISTIKFDPFQELLWCANAAVF